MSRTGEAVGHRRISIDVVASAAIIFLCATAPAFETDDVTFFNYLNNVLGARPLYFYTGYVHLIPQLVTYALKPLPMLAQVLLYPLLSLLLALALYRELAHLFRRSGSRVEAGLLAIAVLLVMRVVEPVAWANISNAMWLAMLLAMLVVIRVSIDGVRFSLPAAAGIVIVGLSFPPGGWLAVLLVMQLFINPRTNRLQSLVMAGLIVCGHLAIATLTPESSWNTRLLEAPRMFLASFREYKLHGLIAMMSVLILGAALARVRRDGRFAGVVIVASACVVGWGSIAMYVASSRFVRYDGGFQARYVAPPLFCALLSVSWMALSMPERLARARAIGVIAGVAMTCGAIFFYGNLRGPMETALMKYRFVLDAGEARRHCRPDEVFVFEADAGSPIVFCRPRTFPPGDNILSSFTPQVGASGPEDVAEDRPYVINPRPLF